MKQYWRFSTIVEKNRRAASQRKHETLVQRSAKSVAQNLSMFSPGALNYLPDHVLTLVVEEIMADPRVMVTVKDDAWDLFPVPMLQAIWDALYERSVLTIFSGR